MPAFVAMPASAAVALSPGSRPRSHCRRCADLPGALATVASYRDQVLDPPPPGREFTVDDLIFVLLTIAVFVLLGLAVKAVEKL